MKNKEEKIDYYSLISLCCILILITLTLGYHGITEILGEEDTEFIIITTMLLVVIGGMAVSSMCLIVHLMKEYNSNKKVLRK